MERIDRQQRVHKKPIPAVSQAHQDSPHATASHEPAVHWLSPAMAMWIRQGQAQTRADQDSRHAGSDAQR